jgi:NAD(P)-dependent dehydrogenase (short-subunit alcohol dehydrogenase family)
VNPLSPNNPFSLEGKSIFVTGASSGLGENIALECSKMGASVVVTGRNKERLDCTFTQLHGTGHCQIVADLTKSSDLDLIVQELPQLDGLVFNAGLIKTLPVKNIGDAAMMEIFQTNILSTIQLVSRLLKNRKINKKASIIFISSISTFHVKVGNSLYSATKGALNSFGKVLALELAPQKIRVNSIQPGLIKTRILDGGTITAEQIGEHSKLYPMGIGKPSDIGLACVYLLSEASEWVTGSVMTIDGGVTLR